MPTDGTREIAMRMIPTRASEGADAVVGRIAALVEDVIAQTQSETGAERSDFLGVGIGSPGPLDRARGVVIVTPNLGWRDFPLRDEVAKRSESSRHARQRRQLRDARRMVASARPRAVVMLWG